MARQRRKKGRPISGWLVLDKPHGPGSTECVSKIKWLYQAAKAGHAGTLDPLASGMLPIALGEATKTVPYIMEALKVYRFTICWGVETATDDLEGAVTQTSDDRPDQAAIEAAISDYVGDIEQVPPTFSAVKIAGQRAYDLARDGETVELKARPVFVERFDLIDASDKDCCEFEIECGKGTYVRSLARDIGRQLGCFGHIANLRRTAVGPFDETDLVTFEQLTDLAGKFDALDQLLLPTGLALGDFAPIKLSESQANRVRLGNPVLLRGAGAPAFIKEACAVAGNELIATGDVEKGSFRPRRVFRHSLI